MNISTSFLFFLLLVTLSSTTMAFSSIRRVGTGLRTQRALKASLSTTIGEGQTVPNVIFKARVRDASIGGSNPFTWKDVSSKDLFENKRVVLFSLPGAFTPTCSSFQLPGYEKAYDEIKKLGVDEVYCLSVNDAFVMRQWGLQQSLPEEKTDTSNALNPGNFQKVKLIPDGSGLFTKGMGMQCQWEQTRGFGMRSWRYACVINNMKVEKMFIEAGKVIQESVEDPYEVTDAKDMLKYLQSAKK